MLFLEIMVILDEFKFLTLNGHRYEMKKTGDISSSYGLSPV
jgi:hypothetical protein